MIEDVLNISKIKANVIENGHEKCNLSEVLLTVIEEFSILYGHKFQVNTEGDLSGFWNSKMFRRILENLLTNAVKYGDGDSLITINLITQTKNILLSVHNQGNPIDQENLKKIFEPFIRTNDSIDKKGWGLGLPIVQGLINSLNGEISVQSSKEEGTIFIVKLPYRYDLAKSA
jgi:signal transduction histidine kinase